MATQMEISPEAPRLTQFMRLGPSAPQLGLLFALAAGLTLAAGVVIWAMRPSFVPLDLGLSESSSGDVIATLQASDTRFEVDRRSGMILVPSEELREIRMRLAANGLSGGREAMTLGELSKNQGMGPSQSMEQALLQQALETEIAHTVAGMRAVKSARVHLGLPRQTAFVRSHRKPSASVVLTLAPGRALDAGQVQGIANLVASSVPNMELGRVSVLDQHGRLLSRDLADGELAATNRFFDYKRNYERTYTSRIEELLSPIVGLERVRAQVNAELDFSHNERREEAFAGAPEKMRSEQIQDQRSGSSALASGVPGALTNQPPEGGTLAASTDGEGGGDTGSMSKSTTRNFELDKTVVHRRDTPGRLVRLSIAVLVDDKVTVGEKGAVEREPREQAELDSITELVKEAVGFDAERGDSVVVINRSFEAPVQMAPMPAPALWEQAWFEPAVKNTLAAMLMGLLLLLVLRPTVRALTRRADVASDGAGEGGVDSDMGLLEADKVSIGRQSVDALPPPPRVYGDILNLAREMANDDPKRVAMVLRKWVGNDE